MCIRDSANAANPSGFNLPQRGYSLARSSFVNSVPNELIVIIIALRSASNWKVSKHIQIN